MERLERTLEELARRHRNQHGLRRPVAASLRDPVRDLHGSLGENRIKTHSIGNCVAARNAIMAIYEGRKLAMAL